MKFTNRFIKLFPFILFIGFVAVSCSTKPHININYRLEAKSDALEGTNVFLSFKDGRPDKTIFSDNAQKEFRQFSGKFPFFLAWENQEIFQVGAFDLPGLFKAAFSKRLENLGINVTSEQRKEEPVIEINLKSFFLDLTDGKWVLQISYDTYLIKDEQILARQTTSGSAERFKMFGTRGADKVLSELFTDVINEPDIIRLFQHETLK